MRRSSRHARACAQWWACFVWIAAMGAARAQADGAPPALHWFRGEGAADCVDPRTLAELVETYTGPVLVPPSSADASVEAAIERTAPEEFRLRVSITVTRGRPAGQRVLTLPAVDCRKLDGAIAFVIASTLDPDLGNGALPPELSWLGSERPAAEELRADLANTAPAASARPWQPPAAAEPEAATPSSTDEAEVERRAGNWELGYAFAAGRGRVPSATIGGLVSMARLFGPWFAVALQLRGNANVGGFDVEARRSVAVSTFDGALLACGRAGRPDAHGLQGCLGPSVGFFSAHGEGFSAAHTVVQPLYGAQLKLEASLAIASGLSLTAAGLLDVGFRRPTVNYRILMAQEQVFRSELWGIQGALGLKHTF